MPQPATSPKLAASQAGQRPIHMFVLIDALGWTYLDGREFLSDILPFRKPLRTVLGFSSGAIPAILTGTTPARNGHWNLFYYDPEGSPFRWLRKFLFLPHSVLDCRVSSKIVKEIGRRILRLGPGFDCCVPPHLLPWFNWVEKKSIYEHGGITGAPSIFDDLAKAGVRHRVYTYHHWTDADIIREARKDLANNAAEFYFVYLSEMDAFLHHHCLEATEIEKKLAWYEAQIRELFELARSIDAAAGMTVFSDHGMTPVVHRHDLFGEIEPLGLRMPEDYLAVYDSTMARFWFFSDRARAEISRVLASSVGGHILGETELDRLGVRFPDHRFGELVFLLKPGWLIARSGFENPRWIPTGMHGYHPDDKYSDACFLSDRKPPVEIRTIIDVYNCMRQSAFSTCAAD